MFMTTNNKTNLSLWLHKTDLAWKNKVDTNNRIEKFSKEK